MPPDAKVNNGFWSVNVKKQIEAGITIQGHYHKCQNYIVGLEGRNDDVHFACLAVTGDLQDCSTGFEVKFAGKAVGVLALEAGTKLAADAIASVHQRV